MENNTNFCNSVVTIPQFIGTCWFNAILMSILYSQNSRKLLLYNNNFKKQNTPIFKIFHDILYKNYISPEKAKEYFQIIRPEIILEHLIPDKNKLDIMFKKGWGHNLYISKFIKYIGKKYILFDYYNKNFYCGITDNIEEYFLNNTIIKFIHVSAILPFINKIKSIKNIKSANPDYLIVNIWDNLANHKDKFFIDNYIKQSIDYLNDRHTLQKMNINNTLHTFSDIITFNGDIYILDSCLLANYNKDADIGSHAIVGITCKNERYVYNGWTRATIDPAKNELLFKQGSLPCELIKYNWDIHLDKGFCLNPVLCKLEIFDKSPKNNLCFSFNKGKRTLVYVKLNSKYKSLDENIKSSSNIKKCPSGKILKLIKVEKCVLYKNDDNIKTINNYKTQNIIFKNTIKDIKNTILKSTHKIIYLKDYIKKLTSKSEILKIRSEIKVIKNKIKIDMNEIISLKNKIRVNNEEIKKLI